jgi:hypothetical protein
MLVEPLDVEGEARREPANRPLLSTRAEVVAVAAKYNRWRDRRQTPAVDAAS